MRANARAILTEALRDAHRWLDELLSDPRLTLESLATREGQERASDPDDPVARFPRAGDRQGGSRRTPCRGFGLKRLVDLPMAWQDQWRALGLQAPAQA
jgi:hypothetical protein